MEASRPTPLSTTGAYLNWFEGNVAIGPSGTLYAPNDDYRVYAVDRTTGEKVWSFRTPDQTWSLPAIDRAGTLYFGNNELLSALGQNTYAVSPTARSTGRRPPPAPSPRAPLSRRMAR